MLIVILFQTVVNTGSDIICHMDKYFKDPHEFRPDRWLGGSRKDIVPFSYIPFGFGARMCIGRRFAEQEIMLAIAVVSEIKMTETIKCYHTMDFKPIDRIVQLILFHQRGSHC